MKFFLFFLVILSCFAEQKTELKEDAPIIEFFKGFLTGIGETKTIEDLKKCLKEAEPIFAKIKKALELIHTMKLEKIVEGITLLIEAVKELMGMVKPCLDGFETLKLLIKKIAHIDIKKLAQKILANIFMIIKIVKEAIDCLKKHEFNCAGKALGTLLKIMILDDFAMVSEESKEEEFIKGFLKALGETTDPKALIVCAKDLEKHIEEILAAIQKIISLKPLEMLKGLGELVVAVTRIFNMLKPCTDGYPKVLELIKAVETAEIKKIFERFMKNPFPIVMLIVSLINNIIGKDWADIGLNLGKLLKAIFIA